MISNGTVEILLSEFSFTRNNTQILWNSQIGFMLSFSESCIPDNQNIVFSLPNIFHKTYVTYTSRLTQSIALGNITQHNIVLKYYQSSYEVKYGVFDDLMIYLWFLLWAAKDPEELLVLITKVSSPYQLHVNCGS